MSGDDTNGEDFCIQNPPLYVTIRDILQEYPDGQIFKVSQNCSKDKFLYGDRAKVAVNTNELQNSSFFYKIYVLYIHV